MKWTNIPLYTFLCVLLHLRTVQALENWPSLEFQTEVAIRTQRDISYPVPIDQQTHYGVSLSQMLFDNEGYVDSSLLIARNMLDVGVKILSIDLYWNNFTSKWQLCPAPYPVNGTSDIEEIQTLQWNGKKYSCQPSFSIDKIMVMIYVFFQDTNTNMNVNYLQILYRLHSFQFDNSSNSTYGSPDKRYYSDSSALAAVGNSSLEDTVNSLGTHLFTPTDLDDYRTGQKDEPESLRTFYNQSDETFPDLYNFIYTAIKRATVTVIDDGGADLRPYYNISRSDKEEIFVDGDTVNVTAISLEDETEINDCLSQLLNSSSMVETQFFDDISLKSHYRYVFDGSGDNLFNNVTFKGLIRCGYSPILNGSSYEFSGEATDDVGTIINDVIPLSFWSWSQEGSIGLDNTTDEEAPSSSGTPVSHEDDRTQEAFKCVAVTAEGWQIANCYQPYAYACQNIKRPNEWKIQPDKKQYFDAYKAGNCPPGYLFGTPRSSVEMSALMYYITKSEAEFPVWIDVNDITVTNCFVTDGPYAECPYQRTVSTRALAGLLAPSAVVAVFILFLMFLENIIRNNPIQTNRKRFWKKKINEYYEKNEYEGVPS